MRVARASVSAGKILRGADLVDGAETCTLVYSPDAPMVVVNGKRSGTLRPGEATLVRDFESGYVASPRRFTTVAVHLPLSELSGLAGPIDAAVARAIPRSSAPLKLLKSYVGAIASDRVQHDPDVAALVHRHLVELATLCFAPGDGNAQRTGSIAAVRHDAVLAFISEHYWEPDLTAASAGARLGISVRYLERLLEGTGHSFTARVRELRLQRARAHLFDPTARHQTISDIAFAAGFSDLSHFYRVWRHRFGDTPAAARRGPADLAV